MGVVHKPNPDWASHIPVLIKALEITEGPVLELGMGMFSTPLLHMLCADKGRRLFSYENYPEFYEMFTKFASDDHKIHLVANWHTVGFTGENDSVALVDWKPAEDRNKLIKQLVDCDYVIIHDSEDPLYGYEEIYPLFAYRYDYKKFPTWTTVLSNKHELHQFHHTLDK